MTQWTRRELIRATALLGGGALAARVLHPSIVHALTQAVLVDVRDRVKKLKDAGRSVQDVVAARPTAHLDDPWGKGFMMPNDFLTIVYNTL